MGSVREDTVSGVKWSAVERFSVQGIQFVISIILARLLSPSDFGVIAMLSIFISVSQTFVDSGFSSALIRKLDRSEIDFSTTYIFNFFIGLLSFCIFWIISPYVAHFYLMPILENVMPVLGLSILLDSLTVVQIAILTINISFRKLAYINLCSALLSGAIGITCAYNDYGVWSLVWQAVSRSAINVILLHLFSRWQPKLQFSKKSFHSLFSFGSKILLSSLINTIYANTAPLVIGKFYTSKDLGFYDRGRQFGRLPMENLVSIFQRVSFPILSRLQNDEKNLIDVYRKFLKLTSMIMFFIAILIIALAKPIVLFVLTSKWYEAIIFLQLFCLAEMFNHVTRLNLNLLQIIGRSDLFLRLEIIKKTISFILLLSAVPFGVIWICISQVVYAQMAMYINTYYTKKLFGLSYIMQIKDIVPYIIKSTLACAPAYLFTFTEWPFCIQLLLGFIISVVVYILLIYRDWVFGEMISVIKNK